MKEHDSEHVEAADMGGRFGPDGKLGVRLNVVHGEGEGYVEGSSINRTLAALDVDYHIDDRTVIEEGEAVMLIGFLAPHRTVP